MWLRLIACPPQVLLGKVRSHSRAVPCRDDGLRVTAAMSQQEASRLGALGPRRASCCCLGLGRVAAGEREGGLITPRSTAETLDVPLRPLSH